MIFDCSHNYTNIFLGQLWRLTSDNKLENQNGGWLYSSKRWEIPRKGKKGIIKEHTSGKVLSVFSHMMVDLQDKRDLLSPFQCTWTRSETDSNGWFRLFIQAPENKCLCARSNSRIILAGMYFVLFHELP